MKISAVITTLNEGANLRRTVDSLQSTLPAGSEIVVVDDGSTDGSADFLETRNGTMRLVRTDNLGVTRARNRGAACSGGDVIVFADAHIETPPGWWRPLVEVLEDPAAGAAAPGISALGHEAHKGFGIRLKRTDLEIEWLERRQDAPYQVPVLPGCCLAMRRDVFQATGGFDAGLRRWGESDNELSVRLWLLGYQLWMVPQIEVGHLFHQGGARGYPINWTAVVHNKLRLAFVHFSALRMAYVVEALRKYPGFSSAMAVAVESDFAARRSELAARRVRDDEWYFEKFGDLTPPEAEPA